MTLDQSQKLQLAVDASVEDAITNIAEQCDVYDHDRCRPREGVDLIAKGVEALYQAQI